MSMEHVFAKGTFAAAAAVTATGAGLGAIVGETMANPYVLTGGVIGAALAGAVALAAKKWFENQIEKLIELPTKREIFAAIDSAAKLAEKSQNEIMEKLRSVAAQVDTIQNNHIHALTIRVAEIESRHLTEDRLERRDGIDRKEDS